MGQRAVHTAIDGLCEQLSNGDLPDLARASEHVGRERYSVGDGHLRWGDKLRSGTVLVTVSGQCELKVVHLLQ